VRELESQFALSACRIESDDGLVRVGSGLVGGRAAFDPSFEAKLKFLKLFTMVKFLVGAVSGSAVVLAFHSAGEDVSFLSY
jgi:hypothetical protein